MEKLKILKNSSNQNWDFIYERIHNLAESDVKS